MESILDTDLQNLLLHQIISHECPNEYVVYKFINRGPERFNQCFVDSLKEQLYYKQSICLSNFERQCLLDNCPYLTHSYVENLYNFRLSFRDVDIKLTKDDNLDITISGEWRHIVLWPTILLSLISSTYSNLIDKDWVYSERDVYAKSFLAHKHNINFVDFGTRRRKNYNIHDNVVNAFKKHKNFVGTSNVLMAMKYNIKPVGTMAHEWIMSYDAYMGPKYGTLLALEKWYDFYGPELSIALTDTYTTKFFNTIFYPNLAKKYSGVRQDSGCPHSFIDEMVYYYNNWNIDFTKKTFIFSNSLDMAKAIEIKAHCDRLGITPVFGIGTNLTNDCKKSNGEKSNPLNIVIKLDSVNGRKTVKLSDDEGKNCGDKDTLIKTKTEIDAYLSGKFKW